jgi:hypothetical protein
MEDMTMDKYLEEAGTQSGRPKDWLWERSGG